MQDPPTLKLVDLEPFVPYEDEPENSDLDGFDYSDDDNWNSGDELPKPKPVLKKRMIPGAAINPMMWSPENTDKIVQGIREADPASDDEDDIITDADIINGTDAKFYKIKFIRYDEVSEIQASQKEEEEKAVNQITLTREKMLRVYNADGGPLEKYILSKVSELPVEKPPTTKKPVDTTKPKAEKHKKKNMYAALVETDDEDEPRQTEEIGIDDGLVLKRMDKKSDDGFPQPDRSIPIVYYESSSDEESEESEESEKTKEEEEEEEAKEAKEEEEEETEERKEWRRQIVEKLLAKQAEKTRIEFEKRTVSAPATLTSPEKQVERRRLKERARMNGKALLRQCFQPLQMQTSFDKPREVLKKVMVPRIVSTLYCKLLMQTPDDMQQCINDSQYMISMPPLATPEMLIASPVYANVMQTPIIPAPLCRNGTECAWFKRQAHIALGLKLPSRLHKVPICFYMHTGPDMLEISGSKVVQCSVMGCISADHYTPGDDSTIAVVHMTRSTDTCGHSQRNYCLNVMGDGCCRLHAHAGPLMLSMIMRGMLAARIHDPYKWPLSNNSYLFKSSREILESRIPVKNQSGTIEKRIVESGDWPQQVSWQSKTIKGRERKPRKS